ncbi:MAG TPA: hypothetical protein DHW82_05760 [Spirochaetia bacterium]|nr:MAG: hypothetical protein A2Y41_13585 [Spirochaetes bacterium GWB1_36_13]HCL56499.1 hypothetical protein [Spirochaetia bacterium]
MSIKLILPVLVLNILAVVSYFYLSGNAVSSSVHTVLQSKAQEPSVQRLTEYRDMVVEIEVEEIRKKKELIYQTIVDELHIEKNVEKTFVVEKEASSEDILEEIPAEKPRWAAETPVDAKNNEIYTVGISFGNNNYEAAFEEAKLKSFEELCRYIKLGIDTTVSILKTSPDSEEKNQKMIKKIVASSKNTFMRESKVAAKYYRKLKPGKGAKDVRYELYLLIAYPKKNIDRSIQEGVEYEKELLKSTLTIEEYQKVSSQFAEVEAKMKELKQKDMTDVLNQERTLVYSGNKMENLYEVSMKAEELEKSGKLTTAYSFYKQVFDKMVQIDSRNAK